MRNPTYSVYVWYGDPGEEWHRHRARLRKWTLRRVLRRLYRDGWSEFSILVERNHAD